MKKGILTTELAAILWAWSAFSAAAYEPQAYTPGGNSPAELAEKQAALQALRSEWSGDNYSASNVEGILSGGGISNPSSVVGNFNANGSWKEGLPSGSTFSEANYDKNKRYLRELLALAYLNKFQGGNHQQLLYDSLEWYFANGHAAPPKYHETFNYHSPTGTVGGLMLILGLVMFDDLHLDRQSDTAVEAVYQEMRDYGRQFINAAPQIRGPNWSFRLDNCLRFVLFTNDPSDMDEYSYHWNKALSFNRWEEESDGVHADWSMMHHGDMNYWGMYGISWTSRVIEYGELFADKPWAYETEQLDFIANTMIEGTRWVMFRGVCDYTSAPKRGTMLLARTDSVASNFKDLYGDLLSLGGNKLTRRTELIALESSAFLPPWTNAGAAQADQPEFSGHRHFWNTEYQAHRRPNFSIHVRRCSQRARPPEDSSIDTSKMHLHYGTGYTPIVRRGDELRLSRLCWDFQHVPGTTVEQGMTVSSGKAASTIRGLNLFSGGVADGNFGFGAFDMQMVQFDRDNSGRYEFINGAGALKANFFFDEGMIALGQRVGRIATVDGNQNRILTTINNVRRLSDVVYSVDGASETSVPPSSGLEQGFTINTQAWIWHDGMGYVIWPSTSPATDLVLSLGDRPFNSVLKTDDDFEDSVRSELGNAAWNAGTFNMFRLWIDHGANPSNDTYAYAVLPDCTLEELKAFVANPTAEIVANSNGVQAVADRNTGIYYASFKDAGTADFGEGKTMAVDRPLLVMAQRQGSSFNFTAANPTHRGLRNPYVPGNGPTVGTIYASPVPVAISGFEADAQMNFSLPTARGEEGASVRGTAEVSSGPTGDFVDWEFDNAGVGGVDSGLTGTNWLVEQPETSTPDWTVTRLGDGAGSSITVEPASGRLILSGVKGSSGGISEALLLFDGDRSEGSISTSLALDSGSTWTAAKFNLVHFDGSTAIPLIECNVQRNGENSNNLITTGSSSTPISGQWTNTFNDITIQWNDGAADITVTGLDTGNVNVLGSTFLADLAPNGLLIRAGSDSDTRPRKLLLERLVIQFPLDEFQAWILGYGIQGSPDSDPDFDFDKDGFLNRDEFTVGSNPSDSSSYPQINRLSHDPSSRQFTIEWDSLEGRLYDVYFSDDLGEDPILLEEGLEYPLNSYTTLIEDTAPRGFFFLEIRRKP